MSLNDFIRQLIFALESLYCITFDVQVSVERLRSFNHHYYVVIIIPFQNVSSHVKSSELLFPLSRATLALKVD